MEQGERDGNPTVESCGGDTDLAACCGARSSRGARIRHVGDTIQRHQAEGLPVASRTDHKLYEGNHQIVTVKSKFTASQCRGHQFEVEKLHKYFLYKCINVIRC